MYKVFINEKRLSIAKNPIENEKNIEYGSRTSLEIAVDLLENTVCPEICVFGADPEVIWEEFTTLYKVVEAAGGIVMNKEDKILFIKRLGKWDLPKGKIEKGETIEKAALREVMEETSLVELILEKYANTTFHLYTERNGVKILKTTYWYLMTYVGNAEPVPQTEEGISKVEWKNGREIERDVTPNTFKNIQLILDDL